MVNLHNVDEKASKAMLTFQDQLFQARRLKDSPKMRETLSKYNVDKKARRLKNNPKNEGNTKPGVWHGSQPDEVPIQWEQSL